MKSSDNSTMRPEMNEAIAILAANPNAANLLKVKRHLDVLSAAERVYLNAQFKHKLGHLLVESTAARLESVDGDGSEHVRALMNLHDMVTTFDGIEAMPDILAFAFKEGSHDCAQAVAAAFDGAFVKCRSEADAHELYLRVVKVLSDHVEAKELIAYYLMGSFEKELLTKGIALILESLTETEGIQYLLYCQVSALTPWDSPLYFDALEFDGTIPKIIMPKDIDFTGEVSEIMRGIDLLTTCYCKLPAMYYALQVERLRSVLHTRVAAEIAKDADRYGVRLPDVLKGKLGILLDGINSADDSPEASEQPPLVQGDILTAVIAQMYATPVAIDAEAAGQMRGGMLDELRYYPDLAGPVVTMASYALADYVIAALFECLQDAGYALSDAAKARMLLYYAMWVGLTTGELAFWDTKAYEALMAQVEG